MYFIIAIIILNIRKSCELDFVFRLVLVTFKLPDSTRWYFLYKRMPLHIREIISNMYSYNNIQYHRHRSIYSVPE